MKATETFAAFSSRVRPLIDARLLELLPEKSSYTRKLDASMKYTLSGGGKRIRPILFLLLSSDRARPGKRLLDFACGIEYIHNYSLVHDDIMDNDTVRRGRETVWKKFGLDTAILTGDALLTRGLELIYSSDPKPARLLNACIGAPGMVSGQAADIEFSGKKPGRVRKRALLYIHGNKTAAFFSGVCGAAAAAHGRNRHTVARFAELGYYIGMLFQIKDDLLDRTGGKEYMKSRSDDANGKLTAPAIMGFDASQRLMESLTEKALDITGTLPSRRSQMREVVEAVKNRKK